MRALYEGSFWKVTIDWTRPKVYEELIINKSHHDEIANLYMISGRYCKGRHKAFYIGKTYSQLVSERLKQPDHQLRHLDLVTKYPRHTLYVSHGIVTLEEGKLTAKRLDQIESVLIYAMPTDHSINIKNFSNHGVKEQYFIENKGYRCGMSRYLGLGVFHMP